MIPKEPNFDYKYSKYTQKSLKVYMCVIIVSPYSPRPFALYQCWGSRFIKENPLSVFKFVHTAGIYLSFTNLSLVYPKPLRYINEFRHVFNLNYLSAHDFINNTNLPWYIRTTYDCYVHIPNLEKMLISLNKEYDPYNDFVFRGGVYNGFLPGGFVHGGPGWIMSRKAVEFYIENEKKMKELFNKPPFVGDDVNIVEILKMKGVPLMSVDSPQFVGPPVLDISYNLTANYTFEKIVNECLPDNPKNGGKPPLPLKDIVFWHNGKKIDYVFPRGKRLIEAAPPNVYLQTLQNGNEFCLMKNSTK